MRNGYALMLLMCQAAPSDRSESLFWKSCIRPRSPLSRRCTACWQARSSDLRASPNAASVCSAAARIPYDTKLMLSGRKTIRAESIVCSSLRLQCIFQQSRVLVCSRNRTLLPHNDADCCCWSVASFIHALPDICDTAMKIFYHFFAGILSRPCHSRSRDWFHFCDKYMMHWCNCAVWLQTFVCTHLLRKLDKVEDLQLWIYFWSCIHRICNPTGDNHCTLCDSDFSDAVQSLRKASSYHTNCR